MEKNAAFLYFFPAVCLLFSVAAEPYDEADGAVRLIAKNRALHRLLTLERQNVEDLKRTLHICAAPCK